MGNGVEGVVLYKQMETEGGEDSGQDGPILILLSRRRVMT